MGLSPRRQAQGEHAVEARTKCAGGLGQGRACADVQLPPEKNPGVAGPVGVEVERVTQSTTKMGQHGLGHRQEFLALPGGSGGRDKKMATARHEYPGLTGGHAGDQRRKITMGARGYGFAELRIGRAGRQVVGPAELRPGKLCHERGEGRRLGFTATARRLEVPGKIGHAIRQPEVDQKSG